MILCLEGVNGAGKSTFAGVIGDLWKQSTGGSARRVDLAQHTDFGQALREVVMQTERVDPTAEAFAFAAARLDGLSVLLATPQQLDSLLILERWAGAVWAYGRADSSPSEVTDLIEATLWQRLPVPTVLVDTAGPVAHQRLEALSDLNKFETRGAAYLDRVGGHYRHWAARREVPVVDGSADIDGLRRSALELLELVGRPS